MNLFAMLAPAAAMMIGIMPLVVTIAIIHWMPRKRVSALPRDLLRTPGLSLRERIDDGMNELFAYMVMTLGASVFFCFVVSAEAYSRPANVPWASLAFVTLASLTIGPLFFVRFRRFVERQRRFHVGLDGELVTAEELNRLMLDGFQVFHDVPIPHGNIDHVVVGRTGVFSINTKHYGRLATRPSESNVIVDYDAGLLRFPDRNVAIPANQIEMEAKELREFLSFSTGYKVAVEGMLALPGWFIEQRIGRGIRVFNPRNPQAFFIKRPETLTCEEIVRVAYQLEQRCRNVEPSAKRSPPAIGERQ